MYKRDFKLDPSTTCRVWLRRSAHPNAIPVVELSVTVASDAKSLVLTGWEHTGEPELAAVRVLELLRTGVDLKQHPRWAIRTLRSADVLADAWRQAESAVVFADFDRHGIAVYGPEASARLVYYEHELSSHVLVSVTRLENLHGRGSVRPFGPYPIEDRHRTFDRLYALLHGEAGLHLPDTPDTYECVRDALTAYLQGEFPPVFAFRRDM